MSVSIRAARAGDLPELAESLVQLPLLRRYGSTPQGLAAALERALAAGEELIVAEEHDGGTRLLGLAWFQLTGTLGKGGYLRLIALSPGRQGSGVGGRLLDAVERAVAKQSRALFLLVSSFNEEARRFYARRGYKELGTLPDFYKAGIDEVVAYKTLDDAP